MSYVVGRVCGHLQCRKSVHDPCSECGRYQTGLAVGPPRLMDPASRVAMPVDVRELVVWLNAKGFIAESVRGTPAPMVLISTRRDQLLDQADVLVKYLTARGATFTTLREPGNPHVHVTYTPGRPAGEIILTDTVSSDVGL